MVDPSIFDEKYYNSSNYSKYLEREERYKRMVEEIHYSLFRPLQLDFKNSPVLDYGCGVGFVVKALVGLGYTDVHGLDISTWATEYGRNVLGIKNLHAFDQKTQYVTSDDFDFSLTLAFDVLEHMDNYKEFLFGLNTSYMLVRIPLCAEDGGKFILDVSENDPTHVVRLTRKSWENCFKDAGFDHLFNVDLGLFYNTSGVMCSMFRKK